ncbi:MAG: hypothetical protein AAGF24_13760 [Cyanobacteria bacterium P01_H01_bin.121]
MTTALSFYWYLPASAAITQATLTEVLDGNQVFIDNQRARVNAVARSQQQIRTGDARAQVRFNTGAVGRLSQNSQMIVAGQCFNIQQGRILVNGRANGCTRSRRLSVRGTTYVVEITEDGGNRITVLEGEVAVAPLVEPDPTEPDSTEPTPPGSDPTLEIELFPDPAPESTPNSTAEPTSMLTKAVPKQFSPWIPRPTLSPLSLDDDTDVDEAEPEETESLEVIEEPTPSESSETTAPESLDAPVEETLVLQSGEEVEIDREGKPGRVNRLSQRQFEALLRGSLFDGFASELPGIRRIRNTFERLFPGARFPVPGVRIPRPRIPGIRIPGF